MSIILINPNFTTFYKLFNTQNGKNNMMRRLLKILGLKVDNVSKYYNKCT